MRHEHQNLNQYVFLKCESVFSLTKDPPFFVPIHIWRPAQVHWPLCCLSWLHQIPVNSHSNTHPMEHVILCYIMMLLMLLWVDLSPLKGILNSSKVETTMPQNSSGFHENVRYHWNCPRSQSCFLASLLHPDAHCNIVADYCYYLSLWAMARLGWIIPTIEFKT